MTSEWRRVSFDSLIQQSILQIGDGYRAKNDELGGSGLIFLRSAHVRDSHIDFDGADRFHAGDEGKLRQKISAPGDVMVTTKGNSTGRTGYVTRQMPRFVYSPHLSFWRSLDKQELVPGFLRAWSNSVDFKAQLKSMCHSTDMAPYLSLSDQRRLEISLPPTVTQESIAALNEALDDRITLLRETNATLEAIAQALFKSWFVDFDPVRAKTEGRAPEGMDEATAVLFPDSFEESELGLVPDGWAIGRIEDVTEKIAMGPFGSNIKVSTFVPSGVPVLNGKNVQDTLLDDQVSNFITEAHAKKLMNSCVRPGDVVFTHRGTLGQVALVPDGLLYDNFVVSQSQFFLRSDRSKMVPEWVTYFFKTTAGLHQLLANTSQVGVPSIARPVSHLRSIKILIPPIALLSRFSDVVGSLHKTVIANRGQAQTLAALRDTLLPRLISGQLRLPDAEAIIEEAAA